MDIEVIIRPLIGGVIGIVTNYIAVRMLFRPLREKRIGKLKVPFTPGIIPKNIDRIAESIGLAISDNLLTEDTIKEFLLSEEIKKEVREKIVDYLNDKTEDQDTIKENILKVIDEDNYDVLRNKLLDNLAEAVIVAIKEANVGTIISEKINDASKETLHNSLLGSLGGNAILSIIARESQEKIEEFIDDKSENFVRGILEDKFEDFSNRTMGDVTSSIGQEGDLDLVTIVLEIYERLITEKLPGILKTLNIAEIVSNRIKQMEPEEIEKIILDVMKRELNALVWLGGLIGIILGLLNLVI